MRSRHEQPQDPQQRRHFSLFRASTVAAIVVLVLAVAALAPKLAARGEAVGSEFRDAAPVAQAPEPAHVPAHVRESAGTDDQYPHEYAGQPPVY